MMNRQHIHARLHRLAINCAPRLLVFLACALLLFLLFPRVSNAAISHHLFSTQHTTQISITGKAAKAANPTGAGRISGQLLNGTHNNAPVANQSVTLQMAQGTSSRDLVTITTDAQGRYTFGALQSDSTVQYAVYTLYQGGQYVTNVIDLSKNASQTVNLTVYDATTSTANLAVVQASILITKPNPQSGLLSISEDFVFENLSTTTYVGAVKASPVGKPNALLFSLPPNARFLNLGSSFNGYTSMQVNTGFASSAAVAPGTSEFSFSFQVPYSGSSYAFAYKALYPTVALSLLTPTDIATTAQGLTPKGPTNTKSGTYSLFQARTVAANRSIGAQLAGLPTPTQATPQQTSFNSGLLWLVALLIILLLLAGLGGYIYAARKRRARLGARQSARKNTTPAARKKVASPATSKEGLLQELLELDQAYEAGNVKKAAYQEQRARLKSRLRVLMSEKSEKRTEVASQAASSSGSKGKE